VIDIYIWECITKTQIDFKAPFKRFNELYPHYGTAIRFQKDNRFPLVPRLSAHHLCFLEPYTYMSNEFKINRVDCQLFTYYFKSKRLQIRICQNDFTIFANPKQTKGI
jgi:hypothetical protein